MAWNFEEKCKLDAGSSVEESRDYSMKKFKNSFWNIKNLVKTETGFNCEIKNMLLSWNNYLVRFDLRQQDTKMKLELTVEPKFRVLAYWPVPPFIVFGIPTGLAGRYFRKQKFEKFLNSLSNELSR